MTSKKISQSSISSISSHNSIAYQVATEYCANIRKDTDNSLGTLDGIMEVFRYEIAERVQLHASALWNAHKVKFRPVMFRMCAESYIRSELKKDDALLNKFKAIRAAQQAKAITAN